MCGFSICFLKSRLYPDSKHEGLNILITASACFHAPRTRTRAHTHTAFYLHHTHGLHNLPERGRWAQSDQGVPAYIAFDNANADHI